MRVKKKTLRCSALVPEGPGAEPLRAARRTPKKRTGSSRMDSSGSKCGTWDGNGRSGSGGRFSGSVSSSRVVGVPGAIGDAVSVPRAREGVPRRTCWQAVSRLRRCSCSSDPLVARACGRERRASAKSADHLPSCHSRNLRAKVAWPSGPRSCGVARSIRGVKMNSFQHRTAVALSRLL